MNLSNLMQQAGQLQARMQKMQEELASLEIDGQSGGGLVTVTLNGRSELKRVRIDPTLMKPGEVEIVEDLVMAAHQDARTKVDAAMQTRMQVVAGGLPLPPGFKLF